MKKTIAIVLMALCVFSVFAQGAGEATTGSDDQIKVVLLTDATGIDDKSFNELGEESFPSMVTVVQEEEHSMRTSQPRQLMTMFQT